MGPHCVPAVVYQVSGRNFVTQDDRRGNSDAESRDLFPPLPPSIHRDCRCLQCPQFSTHYAALQQRRELDAKVIVYDIYALLLPNNSLVSTSGYQISTLRHQLSDAHLHLLPEYQQRMAVLRRLRYIEEDGTVLLKVKHANYFSN